jgi:hypothetical protein
MLRHAIWARNVVTIQCLGDVTVDVTEARKVADFGPRLASEKSLV